MKITGQYPRESKAEYYPDLALTGIIP